MTNVEIELIAAPAQLQDEPKGQGNPLEEIDIYEDNKKTCVYLK